MARFELTRDPGRGHPRNPPAPAGAARRHQDRARNWPELREEARRPEAPARRRKKR
ncbi:MAG: hypothetical protein MZW92_08120 [Comamonadaceae bacterium]|nr:hypothetical protein [Comamonadaceae bacterium]